MEQKEEGAKSHRGIVVAGAVMFLLVISGIMIASDYTFSRINLRPLIQEISFDVLDELNQTVEVKQNVSVNLTITDNLFFDVLENITIQSKKPIFGERSFAIRKIKKIEIPDSFTTIASYEFETDVNRSFFRFDFKVPKRIITDPAMVGIFTHHSSGGRFFSAPWKFYEDNNHYYYSMTTDYIRILSLVEMGPENEYAKLMKEEWSVVDGNRTARNRAIIEE